MIQSNCNRFLTLPPLSLIFLIMVTQSNCWLSLYTRANCSRFDPVPAYQISEFVGVWNYVRLFNQERIRAEPNCLRTVNTINKSTITMNISIPDPRPDKDGLLTAMVFGALDSKMEGKGQWIFFSESPLAPSKWIILSREKRHMLYLICGDYPDRTSSVGEIGILSRDSSLSNEIEGRFQEILLSYDLNVTLSIIQQNKCPPIPLHVTEN